MTTGVGTGGLHGDQVAEEPERVPLTRAHDVGAGGDGSDHGRTLRPPGALRQTFQRGGPRPGEDAAMHLPPAVDLAGVDLPTEVVRTARLVLRPPRQDDADDIARASQDPESQRWLPVPVPYTRDDAVGFIAHQIEERAEGRGLLCIVEADGRLVGTAGLHFPGSLLGPGVGYTIAPWARGQG